MSKLILMHMPRCGGTVLSAMLNGAWGPDKYMWFGTWGEHIKKWIDEHPDWQGIGGHFWLHNYADYISDPYIHITTFRNPVERTLSHYYYVRVQDHPLKEEALAMSIEEIYDKGLGWHMQMSNLMTAFLCNNQTVDLELAKENLLKDYTTFGLQERLQEFASVLRGMLQVMGLPTVPKLLHYWPNQSREPLENIPKHVIKLIEENNALDIELYDYVKKVYFEKVYREDDTGDELV